MLKTSSFVVLVAIGFVVFGILFFHNDSEPELVLQATKKDDSSPYSGSRSCRACHERFYELWSTSHHGLAMQPYNEEFAKQELIPQEEPLQVGQLSFQYDMEKGQVREVTAKGEKGYPIVHVMGGKNVYFFLTPMHGGRLQVLPVAYDVRRKQWYNTTGSMVRQFAHIEDEAVDWKDQSLTFNTSCYGCHVSQLSTNYDEKTDTYHTEWVEPGINCETCHGSAAEHVRLWQEAEKTGREPNLDKARLPILRMEYGYTAHQANANCAPCHAKMTPITEKFPPGQKYFDHYDLVTLEDADFYPDGRDLGENYTYTLWRMSPCLKGQKFECVHCHTSSGRYRFAVEDYDEANQACAPCHGERVRNPTSHTHHPKTEKAPKCIDCHMPMTEFARMKRSDHSMRPPMPTVHAKYKSPNACLLCHEHEKETNEWADEYVRKWHEEDYQAPVMHLAGLVAAGRKGDWSRLNEMLAYLQRADRDEIYANSLVRLLRNCPEQKKWPVLQELLQNDPSPLVRSSVAESLVDYVNAETIPLLAKASGDEYRLVRIRAAASLAAVPAEMIAAAHREDLQRATEEYKAAMFSRADNWTSHYNMGNFYMNRQDLEKAIRHFERAMELRADIIPPIINASLVYNALGRNEQAEEHLRRALKVDPANSAAHLNLALLLGEQGRMKEATKHFRAVLKGDPRNAVAAYNLAVIVAQNNLGEAVDLSGKAWAFQPENYRYGYTHAFYLHQAGRIADAIEVLEKLVEQKADYAHVYAFLGQLYVQQGEMEAAKKVYQKAADNERLPENERYQFYMMRQQLEE